MGFKKSNAKSLKLPKGTTLYQQTYDKDPLPKDVAIVKLNVFSDDQGGWFKEVLRVDDEGYVASLKELNMEFKVVQTNISYLGAGAKRFWHIHPENKERTGQNEIWTTNGTLLAGLVDLRVNSNTHGLKAKIVLAPDKALYIPAGVAHGLWNPNNFPVTLRKLCGSLYG